MSMNERTISMLFKVKALEGYALHANDGKIGGVEDFYFDDRHWAVRYLVADTGAWLTGRQVLISPYALIAVDNKARRITVDLTKKQIEDGPRLETDESVSLQFEENFHGFYGWPVYWGGPHMWGAFPAILRKRLERKTTNREGKERNIHLHSTHGASGHYIQAMDGGIGHVVDFIIDYENWAIRYLVVDTRNSLPGKKALISPRWIERVSWSEEQIFINLSRQAVRESPEYTDESLITRDFETRLHGHYGRREYWVENPVAGRRS
jgi:hypothetical protein